MSQTPVSMSAFIAARKEGKTVKELSEQFGISAANCKTIIKQLDLPKRATKPGFVLVDDTLINNSPAEQVFQSNTSNQTTDSNISIF